MSGLTIKERDYEILTRHAAEAYPEECCGVLVGRTNGQGALVERVISAANERGDSRHNRYLISPQAVLTAQQEARSLGLDIVGYYHSHPDHSARPSDFDREHAWPALSYLIVSVAGGQVQDARSWRLLDDRTRFDEEPVSKEADW
jgi:proteasome lid subunit RPN8/RPN11